MDEGDADTEGGEITAAILAALRELAKRCLVGDSRTVLANLLSLVLLSSGNIDR